MKKLSDFETYDDSPYFYEGIVRTVRKVRPKGRREAETVVLEGSGETGKFMSDGVDRDVLIDTLPFTKVYNRAFDDMIEMSVPAYKIWCYILKMLKPHQERFYLCNRTMMDKLGYSSMTTPYVGLIELLEKQFICKSTGDCTYWINPNMAYNGERKDKARMSPITDRIEPNVKF